MCLPRELYAGGNGELFCRPAREIVALHSRLIAEATPAEPTRLLLPADGMVECTVTAPADGEVTLSLHEQPDGRAYRLILRPSKGQIALSTPASEWVREHCRIDASKPIHLRAFLDGSMLECFVNDAYAITRRIYDLAGGEARVTGATFVRGLRLMGISGELPAAGAR
jgi:sucrose-6-phosphate hydrolase SacC (GH32 family)